MGQKLPRFCRSPLAEALPTKAPRTCWRVQRWGLLIRRLLYVGLAAWVPEQSVPWVAGRRCGAGLFGVAKKAVEELRLIIDRRRANSRELPFGTVLLGTLAQQGCSDERRVELLRRFSLPCASQFTDVFLDRQQQFDICILKT